MTERRHDAGVEPSPVPRAMVRPLLTDTSASSMEAVRIADLAGLPAGTIWNRFRPWGAVEDGELAVSRYLIQSTGAYDDDRIEQPDPTAPPVAFVWSPDTLEAVDEAVDGLERLGAGGRVSNGIRDSMRQLLGQPQGAMFAARRAASRRVAGILVLRRKVEIGGGGLPHATYTAIAQAFAVYAGGTDLRATLFAAAGLQIQADLLTLSAGLATAGHDGDVVCKVGETPAAAGALGTLTAVADLAADLVKHRYRDETDKVGFTTFSKIR